MHGVDGNGETACEDMPVQGTSRIVAGAGFHIRLSVGKQGQLPFARRLIQSTLVTGKFYFLFALAHIKKLYILCIRHISNAQACGIVSGTCFGYRIAGILVRDGFQIHHTSALLISYDLLTGIAFKHRQLTVHFMPRPRAPCSIRVK